MQRSLTISVVICLSGCQAFLFRDCMSSTNRLLNVTHMNISRDPIHIPGDESVFADIDVFKLIDSHNYKLGIVAKKLIGPIYIKIPCLDGHIGSCSYDMCQEFSDNWLQRHCPVKGLDAAVADFNCSCPIHPGKYETKATSILHIPVLNTLLAQFAAGDYKVHVTITDKRTAEEVTCFELTFTTTTDCADASCIIG